MNYIISSLKLIFNVWILVQPSHQSMRELLVDLGKLVKVRNNRFTNIKNKHYPVLKKTLKLRAFDFVSEQKSQ